MVANRVWFGGGWTSTDWRRGPTDDDARHRVTQDSGGAAVFFSVLGYLTGPRCAKMKTHCARNGQSTKYADLRRNAEIPQIDGLRAPKRAAVLAVERRSQPARCEGMGGQRDRGARSRESAQCAQRGGVRFALPAAGNPPDRLWPHHTGRRTVAATPAAVPIALGDCALRRSKLVVLLDELGRVAGASSRSVRLDVKQTWMPLQLLHTTVQRCERGCCSTGITYRCA